MRRLTVGSALWTCLLFAAPGLAQVPYPIGEVNTRAASAIGLSTSSFGEFFIEYTPPSGIQPRWNQHGLATATSLNTAGYPWNSAYRFSQGARSGALFGHSDGLLYWNTGGVVVTYPAAVGTNFSPLLTTTAVPSVPYVTSTSPITRRHDLFALGGLPPVQTTIATSLQYSGEGAAAANTSTLYFACKGLNTATELCMTNGGAPTTLTAIGGSVAGIFPAAGQAYYTNSAGLVWRVATAGAPSLMGGPMVERRAATAGGTVGNAGTDLIFVGTSAANGAEPWVTNGVSPGSAHLLFDLSPGPASSDPQNLTRVGTQVFFNASVPGMPCGLFRATGAGLTQFFNLSGQGVRRVLQMVATNTGIAYLVADTGYAYEVWITDGTYGSAPTASLPGNVRAATFLRTVVPRIVISDDTAYGYVVAERAGLGVDLNRVTSTGVVALNYYPNTGSAPSNPRKFITTSDAGQTFFETDVGVYSTNGTAGDLVAISSAEGTPLSTLGSRVVMAAYTPDAGLEVYLGDRAAPQLLLKDIVPGADSATFAGAGVELGNQVLFAAGPPTNVELWRTDGTPAGTTAVSVEPAGHADVHSLVKSGNQVFFVATTAAAGAEPWVTDGTDAGTRLVLDVNPGAGSSSPAGMTALKSGVLFSVSAPPATGGLWYSDGTASGTAAIGGTGLSIVSACTLVGGDVAFALTRSSTGVLAVVRTDGTLAGSQLISVPSFVFGPGSQLACIGDQALVSGVTSSGTVALVTVQAGAATGSIIPTSGFVDEPELHAEGTMAFIAGRAGLVGRELFSTDGGNVSLVADIADAGENSNPTGFGRVGNKLVFSAAKDSLNAEPWALALDPTPPIITPLVSGTLGNNGWYVSPVTVSFTVTEPDSRLVTKGCGAQVISADTLGTTVTCFALSQGGPSQQSVSFKIDATAPAAPLVTAPAGVLGNAQPPVAGTVAEPGLLEVKSGATVLCAQTVAAAGAFSCALSSPLAEGAQTLSVTLTDAAGNVSLPGTASFTVDLTAPAAPVFSAPASAATLPSGAVTYAGTAEVGATVKVTVDGALTPACTATADGAGHWMCDGSVGLADGARTATATATDGAGNTSAAASVSFTVDTTAPAAPVISAPSPAQLTSATPAVSGTAEALSAVSVYFDGSPVASCTAAAAASGQWTCQPTAPLADGSHSVAARATDASLNASPLSAPVSFTVDNSIPGAPVLTQPSSGQLVATATPLFVGTAAAGLEVRVLVDGATTASCTAVASGAGFQCIAQTALSEGAHVAVAIARNSRGTDSAASAQVAFTTDSVAPSAPVVTAPAAGATTTLRPLLVGLAESLSTVRLYLDGVTAPSCTIAASAAGGFTCALSADLTEGNHALIATATDAAGNVSLPSAPVLFTAKPEFDTRPPVLACPADITTDAPRVGFAQVTFSAIATDETDPAPSLSYAPESGSDFEVGATPVTVVATDASGNSASCTFQVTVVASKQTGKVSSGCGCQAASPDALYMGALALLALLRRPALRSRKARLNGFR